MDLLVFLAFLGMCAVLFITAGLNFMRAACELVSAECTVRLPIEAVMPLRGRWLRYALAGPLWLLGLGMVLIPLAPPCLVLIALIAGMRF